MTIPKFEDLLKSGEDVELTVNLALADMRSAVLSVASPKLAQHTVLAMYAECLLNDGPLEHIQKASDVQAYVYGHLALGVAQDVLNVLQIVEHGLLRHVKLTNGE